MLRGREVEAAAAAVHGVNEMPYYEMEEPRMGLANWIFRSLGVGICLCTSIGYSVAAINVTCPWFLGIKVASLKSSKSEYHDFILAPIPHGTSTVPIQTPNLVSISIDCYPRAMPISQSPKYLLKSSHSLLSNYSTSVTCTILLASFLRICATRRRTASLSLYVFPEALM